MLKINISEKQKRFADYYIETTNVENSALQAGYSKTYSRSQSYKLLANVGIKAYIDERMAQLASNRLADAKEVLEYLTSVLRGESESEIVAVELVGEGVSKAKCISKRPDEKEKLRAAELLGKRYGIFTDKLNIEGAVPIIIYGEDKIEE